MESFKQADKKKEIETPKKRFVNLMSEDEIEITRLTMDDIEECVKVMRKCAFDVTETEVGNIVQYGKSFGATVNRMIIGVGLSWPANLDIKEMKITNNQPNALYLEDPAVLLAYEGRGVRRILLAEREKEAVASEYDYAMGYLYEDIPKGEITEYITEAGNQLEKLYLSENYNFSRTEKGIMAFKKLGKPEKVIPKG